MSFSEKDKLKALAIVHIFETSKPFGDYAAVAVLNDGAGISYGINQFTHRSGSLYNVVNTYLGMGGEVGRTVLEDRLPLLKNKAQRTIDETAHDAVLKQALKAAAGTEVMREAQNQIAENYYLLPAISACAGSNFTLPLSLAVIYDSINHGSWEKIRDRVLVTDDDEKTWITKYVHNRDAWLESVQRLRPTAYRTDFFLAQIARGNWNLDLPLNVHGQKLTEDMFDSPTVNEPQRKPSENLPENLKGAVSETENLPAVKDSQAEALSHVEVKRETTGLFVKAGAAFTFLTASGLQVGTLVQQKLSEMTPVQVLYLFGCIGIMAAAIWWYRKADKGAQNRTLALVDAAKDPVANTVKLK